jgi:hypothetical protein
MSLPDTLAEIKMYNKTKYTHYRHYDLTNLNIKTQRAQHSLDLSQIQCFSMEQQQAHTKVYKLTYETTK